MSRTQEIAAIEEVPGNRETARRAGVALQLVRICRWTFFDPIQVRRLVEATGSGMNVRWVWCGLAAGFGALLSPLAGAMDLPGALALPAIAALLALIASIDLHSEGVDALGILCLSVLLFVFAMPATMPTSRPASPGPWFWAASLPLFALGLGFGWKVSQASMNRGFLFLPVGLAMISMAAASPSGSMLGRLGSLAGAEPGRFEAACLLLVLFAGRLAGPQASIGSFTPMAGTETCHALLVTAYRRLLVLAYLSFSAAFLLLHLIRPSPRMALLAAALFLGALLEADVPAYLRLSLWLRSQDGALRAAAREPLVFSLPVLAFQPAGLGRYLQRVWKVEGAEAAGELAVDVLLRTGYRRAAEQTMQEIGIVEPLLFHRLRRRLEAEVPRDPREPSAPRTAAPALRAAAPVVAPALSAITVSGLDSAAIQGALFSHYYQPPRGKEGAPLMALPIWFPVAAPPLETLTLEQVLYRSLGSVREPFRRSRILLPDAARVRAMYTEILAWAVDWGESSLGASLIPVPLSLARLAGHAAELDALAQRLARERAALQAGGGPARSSGCREILELGLSAGHLGDLTAALEAGNAWLLLEDDRDGDSDLKAVRKALDAVFGTAGLSHAAVVLLTARRDCNVLADMQTFSEPAEAPRPRKAERRKGGAGAFAAAVFRTLSRLGSPAARPFLLAASFLGLCLLALVLLRYEEMLSLRSWFSKTHPLRAVLLYLGLLSPMIAGYVWGLGWGSEEVRRSSVVEMFLTLFAFGSVFLVPLPRGMEPGLLKSVCIALASLPAAVLISFSILGAVSLIANVLWLILSVRLCRRLGAEGLADLRQRCRTVLHVAHFSAELPLPHGWSAGIRLPLLVGFRNREILAGLVPLFPSLAPRLRAMVLTGIRKDSGLYSLAAASLVLEALAGGKDAECRSCLRQIASGCAASWKDRDQFGEYQKPSTSLTLNALEYVARRLCYLTQIEELVVVR